MSILILILSILISILTLENRYNIMGGNLISLFFGRKATKVELDENSIRELDER